MNYKLTCAMPLIHLNQHLFPAASSGSEVQAVDVLSCHVISSGLCVQAVLVSVSQ